MEPVALGLPREGVAVSKLLAGSSKSGQKRAAIIRASIEVMNERGYAQATMAEIAAKLNLRDGTLYYYFANKQALAYACHVRSLERFEALLLTAMSNTASGANRLSAFIMTFLRESEEHGALIYFGEFSYLDEVQRARLEQWSARIGGELETILAEGIADGSIRPCEPALVVQLFLGMLIWLAKWVPGIDGLDASRLFAAIDCFSLVGLRRLPDGPATGFHPQG